MLANPYERSSCTDGHGTRSPKSAHPRPDRPHRAPVSDKEVSRTLGPWLITAEIDDDVRQEANQKGQARGLAFEPDLPSASGTERGGVLVPGSSQAWEALVIVHGQHLLVVQGI